MFMRMFVWTFWNDVFRGMNDIQNDCAWNYGDKNLSIGMFMRDYVCWIIVTGFDRMK